MRIAGGAPKAMIAIPLTIDTTALRLEAPQRVRKNLSLMSIFR
jgi:hypothetical protein